MAQSDISAATTLVEPKVTKNVIEVNESQNLIEVREKRTVVLAACKQGPRGPRGFTGAASPSWPGFPTLDTTVPSGSSMEIYSIPLEDLAFSYKWMIDVQTTDGREMSFEFFAKPYAGDVQHSILYSFGEELPLQCEAAINIDGFDVIFTNNDPEDMRVIIAPLKI